MKGIREKIDKYLSEKWFYSVDFPLTKEEQKEIKIALTDSLLNKENEIIWKDRDGYVTSDIVIKTDQNNKNPNANMEVLNGNRFIFNICKNNRTLWRLCSKFWIKTIFRSFW